jgi:hypothetical protein
MRLLKTFATEDRMSRPAPPLFIVLSTLSLIYGMHDGVSVVFDFPDLSHNVSCFCSEIGL